MTIVFIAKKEKKNHVRRKFRLTKLKKKLKSGLQTTMEHSYYWTVGIIRYKNITQIYKSYMENKMDASL